MADPVKRPGQIRVEHPQSPAGSALGDLEDRLRSRHGSHGPAGTHRTSAQTALPTQAPTRSRPVLDARDRESRGSRAGRLLAARLGDEHPSDRHRLEHVRGNRAPCRPTVAWPSSVSTTSPSTPAVRRPALRSVTRRTLTSVFECDRSINVCNRRTLGRSPAFDAVKIRCRNRRTSRSARRQSIWRQSSVASSGPLTTTCAVASSLSSGSGDHVVFLFTGSPDRVSPLSRPGTWPGIRPVIHHRPAGGLASARWFPAAFRPPAFASRSSFTRRGVGPSSRSAYRPHGRTPTGFPRSARTSSDRGGRPLYPGDNGAHPDRGDLPAGRLPLRSGQSLHPAQPSHHAGLRLTRHQPRVHTQFARPVFPSPVAARMERAALGLQPRASHPADQEPDDARQRWGQAIEHGPGTTRSTHIPSISNPVVHS